MFFYCLENEHYLFYVVSLLLKNSILGYSYKSKAIKMSNLESKELFFVNTLAETAAANRQIIGVVKFG